MSVSPDGSTLYVVNGKSVEAPNPANCRYINNNPGGGFGSACQTYVSQDGAGNQYAWQNESSGFLTLPVPSATQLASLTGQVAQNNGFNFQLSANDIATMTFLREHIQHVIYIVKENRTFDQILGDLTNGANADPAYTQFPASRHSELPQLCQQLCHLRQLRRHLDGEHGRLAVVDSRPALLISTRSA